MSLSPESIKLYGELIARCDQQISNGPYSHLSVNERIEKLQEFSKYLKDNGSG